MSTELLQSVTVLIAAIGAMLVATVLSRALARKQPADAPRIRPAVPPTRTTPAGPPTPQEVVLAQAPTPIRPLVVARQRSPRRLSLADARKGVVLATILDPCAAHSYDQNEVTRRPDERTVHR